MATQKQSQTYKYPHTLEAYKNRINKIYNLC